jgi:hypothetical protein
MLAISEKSGEDRRGDLNKTADYYAEVEYEVKERRYFSHGRLEEQETG